MMVSFGLVRCRMLGGVGLRMLRWSVLGLMLCAFFLQPGATSSASVREELLRDQCGHELLHLSLVCQTLCPVLTRFLARLEAQWGYTTEYAFAARYFELVFQCRD